MNLTGSINAKLGTGSGIQGKGTFDITYRTGVLGDWLYNKFYKPGADAKYAQMMQDHQQRMWIIQQRKMNMNTSGNYNSWGSPPSSGK